MDRNEGEDMTETDGEQEQGKRSAEAATPTATRERIEGTHPRIKMQYSGASNIGDKFD